MPGLRRLAVFLIDLEVGLQPAGLYPIGTDIQEHLASRLSVLVANAIPPRPAWRGSHRDRPPRGRQAAPLPRVRDRKSVVYGKRVSVRVALGGRRLIKIKTKIY